MKTAIVTGAASGIGLAVVEKFLEEGYAVFGMSRRTGAPITHERFQYLSGDISNADDRNRLIAACKEIDVLVNVAGVAPKVRSDLLEMTEESYDYVMDINLKGTFFLTQLAANKMKDRRSGAICNISSMSAYTSSTNRGEYCISKSGLTMVTKLFADRLAEFGITVNEVRPGIIATDMTSVVKEKYDALIEGGLLPIKRWGKPEDIAAAVWTLCNGSLPYVTGQSIDVDGGFHIRRL
ncbi:MAG: 3-ketoacyl-ACP reductase [Oscillospiraceae bacterium]|nr:3-ketoacyl-ACP reductase [Oscillospiraceae bacterium]